jgi:hypothetical protein
MRTVTVKITADDIAAGETVSANNCPIALALKRHFPRRKEIAVGDWSIRLGSTVIGIPKKAERFLDRFDDGKRVRPFSFEIEI